MSHEAQLATWELKKSQANPREKFFLLSLARRAGEDHTCWPSIARMVEDTGFDRKTLIDVRQALIGRSMISYTGRMVGRSGQIPEMRLNYVLVWEKARGSPRLNDEHETVDKLTVTSPKNGTGTSTEIGTGTSPKNGTLNRSLEKNNRNKSFCLLDEQKKRRAVDNTKKQDRENKKKHPWADKAKEPSRADVTKQSTSYDKAKQSPPTTDTYGPGYHTFVQGIPLLRRKHARRQQEASADKAADIGTGVQNESGLTIT